MIEKLLEANIIAAIEALTLDGLAVRGSWQAASEGEVKDTEDSTPAACAVHVSPRATESFGMSICTIDVSLALVVRADLCPTGSALETYASPIADMILKWNLDLDCSNDCGLATDGFSPGGLQIAGGEGPTFDRATSTWAITFSFAVRGVASCPETTLD